MLSFVLIAWFLVGDDTSRATSSSVIRIGAYNSYKQCEHQAAMLHRNTRFNALCIPVNHP